MARPPVRPEPGGRAPPRRRGAPGPGRGCAAVQPRATVIAVTGRRRRRPPVAVIGHVLRLVGSAAVVRARRCARLPVVESTSAAVDPRVAPASRRKPTRRRPPNRPADHAEHGAGSVLGVVADDPRAAAGAGPEPVAVELHLPRPEPEAPGRAPDRLGPAVVMADGLDFLAVPAGEPEGEATGPGLDLPPAGRGEREEREVQVSVETFQPLATVMADRPRPGRACFPVPSYPGTYSICLANPFEYTQCAAVSTEIARLRVHH